MLPFRLQFVGVGGTIGTARAMIALRVAHQIRFQLECFGANCTGEWSILRMGDHMVTVQMAIGELALAHLTGVHLFLGMLVVNVLFERVHC